MSPITTKEGHGDSPTSVLTDCSSLLLFYYKYLMHGSTMEDRNFSSVNDLLKWIPAFSSVWAYRQALLGFESEMSLSGSYRGTHGHPLMALMGTAVEPSGGVMLLRKWVVEGQAHISPVSAFCSVWMGRSEKCQLHASSSMDSPATVHFPPRWNKSSLLLTKSNLLPLGCSLIDIVL